MFTYDGRTIEGHGPVITINTWKAYFELMTHVAGTRSDTNYYCLSDPPELLESGRVFYARRSKTRAKAKPRSTRSK